VIFSWFDAGDAKKFGESLALFYVNSIPPVSQVGDKAFAQKAEKLLTQMANSVAQFKQTHKLNVYTKAQLGNAFSWTLKDAKVSTEYCDKLTRWLMMHIG
jgi:hypothetical protein